MRNEPAGLLVLHKPVGATSRQTLDLVTHLLPRTKAGHAGTLDPLASGVLVVCIGKATRLIPYVQRMRKHYTAMVRFGQRSSTHDLEAPVEDVPFAGPVDAATLEQCLSKFRGEILQVPPQHSAVHVQGRRAYEAARRGGQVVLEPRPVKVHRLECTRLEYPVAEFVIECSSGTYVRSLVRDIGDDLGCGAVMTALVRSAVGPFKLADAIDPDGLTLARLNQSLLPVRSALQELPSLTVPAERLADIIHGRPLPIPSPRGAGAADREFTLCDDTGAVLAVAELDEDSKTLRPRIVLIEEDAVPAGSGQKGRAGAIDKS